MTWKACDEFAAAGLAGGMILAPGTGSVQMVRAALDKVPELDPQDITDLMLGCGLPGGESGWNMGRNVAVLLGYDHLPGTTITRYCSSSLQTTRMAFHAIKAGEGDVYISAGVETVSRFGNGTSDSGDDIKNPLFASATARTEACSVPSRMLSRVSRMRPPRSFDHLVRAHQQRSRYVQAESTRSPRPPDT